MNGNTTANTPGIQGLNIFAQQVAAANVLANTPQVVNGIDPDSLMRKKQPTPTQNFQMQVGTQNVSSSSQGGNIAGWKISNTQIVSPNGNIVIDAANNRLIMYNGGIAQVVLQG